MQLWVDADACPSAIKQILYRASSRVGIELTLVANQALQVPRSSLINAIQVPPGFDVADNYIVQHCSTGDLVITADIPLAAEVIDQGAMALNPRGTLYDRENIQQRLAIRNYLDEARSSGQFTGGPAPFSKQDQQTFANALDRLLARHC